MRILFVSEYYPPIIKGGGEINLQILTEELARNDFTVTVLTSYNSKLPINEVKNGVNIIRRLRNGKNPENIISNIKRAFVLPKSIIIEVKKISKDIDIIHLIGNTIIVSKELKKLDKIIVATIESYPTLCPKGDRFYKSKKECEYKCTFGKFISCQVKSYEIGKMKNYFFLKYNPLFLAYLYYRYKKLNNSLKYCHVITVSAYVKKLLNKYGVESEIIPNIINENDFDIPKKKNKKIQVSYFGSLTRYKGAHLVVECLKDSDVRIAFYGNGNLKEEILKRMKDYNMDGIIYDSIEYEKIPKEYAKSDIVIFPSIWPEPFGRITIESMASGTPVIGSKVGGISETLKNGGGILITPGDINEIKDAVTLLIKDEKLRENIGRKGKEIAQNYSKKKTIMKIEGYYKRLK